MSTQSSSSTKPRSSAPTTSSAQQPAAKPHTKIHSLALIADRALLTGPHTITIAASATIHPHARLHAATTNITIGEHATVCENAIVGSATPNRTSAEAEGETILGPGVLISSSASVASGARIGDYSTLSAHARVGAGAVVGKWCKICPSCGVLDGEVVEDFTAVMAQGRRVDWGAREREEVRAARMRGRVGEGEGVRGLVADGGAKWRG